MSDQEYGEEDFEQDHQEEEQQQNQEEQENQAEEEQNEEEQNNDEDNQEPNEQQNEMKQSNNEQEQQNQSNVQQEPEIVESEQEQSIQEPDDINLQSVDAVSVKVDKQEKKPAQKKSSKFQPKGQQQMVAQLLKQHKEKQKQLQKREDDIYVQEQIQKKQPKPQRKPQVVTKQKLVFDKETKAKLDSSKIGNQEKAALLTKDLAKKLDKPIVVKEKPKQIEIKKPGKGSEAKPKVNLFEVKIGAGIPSKLNEDADEKASKDRERERNAFLEQKKREKEQGIKFQQEQDELLKQKQKDLRKAQEKALEKDNKVLVVNNEKQQEIKQVYEAKRQELIKEKQEDVKDQLKKDMDILRALKNENQKLQQEVKNSELKVKELDKKIELESRKDNVIQINGVYKSLRKVRLRQGIEDIQTELVSGQSSQVLAARDVGEPDISQKVANKIALNGLELKDAYALLDEDKDGALTIKEIQNNISRLNLNLSEVETFQFIQQLDKNSDGVLTEQEFITFLTAGYENQKDYIKIMGNIQDILNPIVLEERRLHIKYLQKYLLKEIEAENQKDKERKPQYEKLIKKLKRTEKLIDALKGTTSDKGIVKQQCDQLRQDLRQIQDKRNKIVNELNEKKDMIKENIDELIKQLGDKCQEVLEQKEKFNFYQTQTQRLQLKLLSMEQIKNKYKKELNIKNELELEGGQKQNTLQALRLKEDRIQQMSEAEQMEYLHYVIILQKCCRGFIFKRKLKRKLKNLKECAHQLLQFIQKKQKQIKIKSFSQLEEYVNLIKRQETERKEREIQQQQQQKLKKLQEQRAIKGEKYVLNQLTAVKQDERLTASEQILKVIPQVILIQKVFRRNKKGLPINNQAVNVSFGIGNTENCQICGLDIAEMICKQCEKPILCDACFKLSHKNYKRKNHEFYIIVKNEYALLNQQKFNNTDIDEVLSNQ